jgi:hypothetical protein
VDEHLLQLMFMRETAVSDSGRLNGATLFRSKRLGYARKLVTALKG